MAEFAPADRAYVRRFLEEKFNLNELKTLAFDLGIDYEMFPHATKPEFTRGLLSFFERKGRLAPLIQLLLQERPDDTLVQILARVPEKEGFQKVQVILSNDQLASKPDLRQKMAELLGITVDEVMLIATAPGSIKVLFGLPPEAVERLETLDLPYNLAGYEIIDVTRWPRLPNPARHGWRSGFQAAVEALVKTGGATLLGKVVLWVIGTLAVLLLLGAGATAVWWNRLPELRIVNSCGRPLAVPVPDIGRNLLGLPPEIAEGEAVAMKAISGPGIYRLVLEGSAPRETAVLILPRPLPIINTNRLELGRPDDTLFRLDGRLVTLPGEFEVAPVGRHELELCASP